MASRTSGQGGWLRHVRPLAAWFARDATVFTGLDQLTLPLLRQLADSAGSRRHLILIEPDEAHPLLDEARRAGARVIIGDPASPRLLRPIVSGLRGCELSRLYAVGARAADNEAVLAAAARILRRYSPDAQRQPRLVALIEDPRQAEAWRCSHGGTAGAWHEDALSSAESTARGLVGRAIEAGSRELVLCGDGSLALAILRELGRRAWEQAELANAAAAGRGDPPPAARPPLPVERVLLVDPRAGDIRREYVGSVPCDVLKSGPAVVAQPARWRDHLLGALDAMDPTAVRDTAVIIVEGRGLARHESSLAEGGRVARLHQETPVFVLTSPGESGRQQSLGRLIPFERSLLVDGGVPEDSWTRVARHWHECCRLRHLVRADDPSSAGRLPRVELDDVVVEDSVLRLRSILAQVAALGRQWTPVRLVPSGSFVELSQADLERVATAEHARAYRRRLAAGSSAGGSGATPWTRLRDGERAERVTEVRRQLARLEEVGFLPVVPVGGPPTAGSFERVGVVSARRLAAGLHWALPSGEELRGDAGDWRVVDDAGTVRTVTDVEFRSSHSQLDGGRWERTGVFRAWPAPETVVIRTKEGSATARPGDWVVEGPGGERWPVSDGQFRRSYRPRQNLAATAGQTSKPAAISAGRQKAQAFPVRRQPSA
jgi:hypothetical protein